MNKMKRRDFCEEPTTPLDIRQVFLTDLLLLGFEKTAASARIPLNKNLFDLPNKAAFETVMHFLFKKLNPIQCREYFRDCWPIVDKKQEHLFRKACIKWLIEIAEKEPEAHLPRVVASLFLSPGGGKFCHFLFAFTRYVLLKTIRSEFGCKERLHPPTLTPECLHLGDLIESSTQANTVRYRSRFFHRLQEYALIQRNWQDYAGDLVKEHRHLCKLVREKERELNTELQVSAERGSPLPRRRKSESVSDYDLDIQTVRRTQKVQKVRSLWKSLCDYYRESQQERDIIQSILQGVADKYKIDASHIDVKVPEVLLREFDREIKERSVCNTYEGGNLNLLSIIQLWNLSLHLYIEKLHEAGIPDLKDVGPRIHTHVHTHHAHLADLRTLESRLKKEMIPDLKSSISDLQNKLDNTVYKTKTPPAGVRTKPLGLGLLPPTPPVTFNASPVDSEVVPTTPFRKTPSVTDESTPEAASRLLASIREERQSPLVQGSPLFAARAALTGMRHRPSKLPVQVPPSSEKKLTARKRQRSAPGKVTAAASVKTPTQDNMAARGHLTAQVKRNKPAVTKEKLYSTGSLSSDPGMTTPTTPNRKELSGVFSSLKRYPETPSSRERAENVLVDKIVDSIVSFSPLFQPMILSRENTPQEVTDINLQDPLAGLDQSAFEKRDKIARSPLDADYEPAVPKMNLDLSREDSAVRPTVPKMTRDSNRDGSEVRLSAVPRMNLDTSRESLERASPALRSADQGSLVERLGTGVDSPIIDLNLSDTNNNNGCKYIGDARQELDEIFRKSPDMDDLENKNNLEELLSFSMKMDDVHHSFLTNERTMSQNSSINSETRRKKVQFGCLEHESPLENGRNSSHIQNGDIVDTRDNLLNYESEISSPSPVVERLKKFTLDEDLLRDFEDNIVIGGEVLNCEQRIEELKHNESILSNLHEEGNLLDFKNTSEIPIEVPLIDIKADGMPRFTLSPRTPGKGSTKFASIHSNLLDESIEDLNDISLGKMAAPDEFDFDDGPYSPPRAISPFTPQPTLGVDSKRSSSKGLSNDVLMRYKQLKLNNTKDVEYNNTKDVAYRSSPQIIEEEKESDEDLSPTPEVLNTEDLITEDSPKQNKGISNDLLMRFQKLKLSNAHDMKKVVAESARKVVPAVATPQQDLQEQGLDMVYLMRSPRPREDEKKFTLDLAFETDSESGNDATPSKSGKGNSSRDMNLSWTSNHRVRFQSRLEDMLGDDDSLLVPSSP